MSADPEVEFKTIVVGGGNVSKSALIANILDKLDNVVVIDKPTVIEIKPPPSLPDIKFSLIEHGSYRQFEKVDKRKNFRTQK